MLRIVDGKVEIYETKQVETIEASYTQAELDKMIANLQKQITEWPVIAKGMLDKKKAQLVKLQQAKTLLGG